MEGKKGYFLDEIGSMSLVPETMAHQISQLFRWFTGQSGIMYDYTGKLIKQTFKRKLKFRQSLDIVLSSLLVVAATSFYFLGIFYAIIYMLEIPLVRAYMLGQRWLVIILSLTFIIYFATISATTMNYSIVDGTATICKSFIPKCIMQRRITFQEQYGNEKIRKTSANGIPPCCRPVFPHIQ